MRSLTHSRYLIDTNVLLDATFVADGYCAACLKLMRASRCSLYVSDRILSESEAILNKVRIAEGLKDCLFEFVKRTLSDEGIIVVPTQIVFQQKSNVNRNDRHLVDDAAGARAAILTGDAGLALQLDRIAFPWVFPWDFIEKRGTALPTAASPPPHQGLVLIDLPAPHATIGSSGLRPLLWFSERDELSFRDSDRSFIASVAGETIALRANASPGTDCLFSFTYRRNRYGLIVMTARLFSTTGASLKETRTTKFPSIFKNCRTVRIGSDGFSQRYARCQMNRFRLSNSFLSDETWELVKKHDDLSPPPPNKENIRMAIREFAAAGLLR